MAVCDHRYAEIKRGWVIDFWRKNLVTLLLRSLSFSSNEVLQIFSTNL